jgi:PAS domain S-box-containing protein
LLNSIDPLETNAADTDADTQAVGSHHHSEGAIPMARHHHSESAIPMAHHHHSESAIPMAHHHHSESAIPMARGRFIRPIRDFLAAPVFEDADIDRASVDIDRASADIDPDRLPDRLRSASTASEEKTRAARLLNTILLVLTGLTILLVAILSLPPSAHRVFNLSVAGAIVAIALGIKLLMRRGRVRTASVVLVCALLVMTTAIVYVFGGVRDNAATAYFLVVAIAAMLLGGRAALIFGLLGILSALGIFYVETRGAILFPLPASVELADWLILAGVLTIETFLLRSAVNNISEGFNRAHRNARALTQSNRELQASRDAMEDRARELTEERNFIFAVLNTTGALVVVLDPEGRIVRFNRACEQVTGYSFDDVRSKHVWDLFLPPESVKPVKAVFRELRTRKFPNEAKHYWITKDEDRRLISWSNNVLLDDEGEVEYIIGTGIDITERKQAEQRLARERKLLHALMDNVPDHIYFKDTHSRFIRINKSLANWFGLSAPDQAVGKTDFDFFTEKHAQQAYADEQKIVRSCQPLIGIEEKETWPDGGETWVLTNKIPLRDEEGQIIGTLGISTDITERKRAEEKLQRYAAGLEQANEELKQFTYVASHNLRGPLVNLKGFAAELRAALAVVGSATVAALPHLDAKQRQKMIMALEHDVPEALSFMDASASDLDRLVNAIQKLSRLNQRELRLQPIDIDALVQATLQTLSTEIEQRQAQVIVLPLPGVVADRTSMEQIWGNLLSNAVKYLDPDRPGEIEITAECADIDRTSDRDEATFHIRDNGRGIAADDMDKVFAPFRRAGKQDVPGEGMGLAYVQTLVRRHGGRIWCESEPGVGTTFSFTVPNQRADSDTDGSTNAWAPLSQTSGKTPHRNGTNC